jgi:hypothetical protein
MADNVTQDEINEDMKLDLSCIEILAQAIGAMRQKGATADRIIKVLGAGIADLKPPTPEELAGEEILAMKIAEVFREEGIPVFDYETGLEVHV